MNNVIFYHVYDLLVLVIWKKYQFFSIFIILVYIYISKKDNLLVC